MSWIKVEAVLQCRLCDPEVGVGLKGGVCKETCDAWHELCRDDFFEYHSLSKELMPCSDNSLVCSQLRELAADGADLCRKAGLRVSGSGSGKKCFDGSVPDLLETCKAKPKPRPDRWKAIMSKTQPLLLLLMVLAVCGGILALFFSAHNVQSTALERTQQPADLPPAKAAGIAAIERHNRKQS